MKIFGHTMGTPEHSVADALGLFKELGLDGAEIVVQDGYVSGLPEGDDAVVDSIDHTARDLGLEIGALAPYVSGINSLDEDERRHEVSRLNRVITMAAHLDATRVRVYSGAYSPEQSADRQVMWDRLVKSLRELGSIASDQGVVLCCENHFSTMSLSAGETADLVREVDSPGVRALYDQANLTFTHQEPYEKAIELQSGLIGHTHAKDLVFTDPDRPFVASAVDKVSAEERTVRSRVVGDGILDWKAILRRLRADGYEGDLSLEYEYRWHPQDLPPPAEGFRVGAERIRRWLSELDDETT